MIDLSLKDVADLAAIGTGVVTAITAAILWRQMTLLRSEVVHAANSFRMESYRQLEQQFFHDQAMFRYRVMASRHICGVQDQTLSEHAAFAEVAGYLDYVGTLVRLGYVDRKLVYSSFHFIALAYWFCGQSVIVAKRASISPQLWDDFEGLVKVVNEMAKCEVAHDKLDAVMRKEMHLLDS